MAQKDVIKISYRTIYILAVIAFIIIAYGLFLLIPETPDNQNNTILNKQTIKSGDSVSVRYVGRLENGTVFDTNIKEVAEKNGIEKPEYSAFSFVVGEHSVISGFEDGVIGMSTGEKKTITIKPKNAYGEVDPKKIQIIPKVRELNRTIYADRIIEVPENLFINIFNQTPVKGLSVNYPDENMTYEIVNVSNDNVTIKVIYTVDQKIDTLGLPWNATVIAVNDTTATIRQNPQNGQIIQGEIGPSVISLTDDKILVTTDAEIGKTIRTPTGMFIVSDVNETNIILDSNHPLAGKTLIFDIEIVSIEKKQ